MATINFAGNSYAGEVLEDVLVYTAKGNETYEAGLLHVKPGIQKRLVLPHIQLGDVVQDNVPTPASPANGNALSADSKGSYTLSERYLDPKDFMIYIEFNPRDFEDYWRFAQPEGPLVFRHLDPKIQATMLKLLLDKKDNYINDAIWMGLEGGVDSVKYASPSGKIELGGATAGGQMKYFDGALARVLKNVAANANANEKASGQVVVAGTTALADGAAVEAALYTMWSKTPSNCRKKRNFKFVMGWEDWDKYDEYLTAKEVKYVENPSVNTRRFKGKEIVVIDGIPDSTIFFGNFTKDQDSCLWMCVDYATDEESVKVERLQANSELYFFQMRLKMDVNIVRPSEIVVWTDYANTVTAPATPVITANSNSITITCATAGAAIQYKIGTGNWTDYSGPIAVTAGDNGKTLTAKATKDGATSAEATHTVVHS